MKRLILWLALMSATLPALAQEPPVFFNGEQYKAFRSLLGKPDADALDERLSVLNATGPKGKVVSAEAYGAVGDGVTNSTAAVNRAIAALGGEGVVSFGGGDFVLQGVNLVEGVHFKGCGSRKTTSGTGVTRLMFPAAPASGVAMFRVPCEVSTSKGYTDLDCTIANSTDIVTTTTPHGWSAGQPVLLYAKNGPLPTGGSQVTLLYAGEAVNGAGLSGSTCRLYGTSAQAITGGSTGVTNFTTDGFVFTAATSDVVTANPNGFRVGTAVQVASTTTLPAGLSAGTTYYVGRPNATTMYLYNSEANAITGGATGLIDITDTGTGTHTIYRLAGATHGLRSCSTIDQFNGGGMYDLEIYGGVNSGQNAIPTDLSSDTAPRIGVDFGMVNTLGQWHIERCVFRNWDIAFRDGILGDIGLYVHSSQFRYNFLAGNFNEQPLLVNNAFDQNYYGVAGRLVDASIVNNYFTTNYVGVSGYLGYTGRWAGATNATATSSVSSTTINGGCFFGNKIVGAVLSNYSTMANVLVVGFTTDTSDDGSTGIRVHGTGNKVVNCTFGEGTSSTSFSRCGILLDTAAGSTCADTLISGNMFALSGCPGIEGGNTQTAAYGTGNYGTIAQVNITGNSFQMGNHRALRITTGNGTGKWIQFINNTVDLVAGTTNGKTNVLASGEGMVEGQFWQSQFNNNYFNNSAGTNTVVGIKQFWASSTPGCQFNQNRFLAASGTAAGIAFAAAVAADTSVQGNVFHVGSTGMTFASTNTATIRNNINFATEFSGTVALNGTTAVTVAHGLALAPPLANIQVTYQDDPGSQEVWVESVDGTNITLDATAAGTGTVNVRASWSP